MTRTSDVPVQPYETKEYKLLERARDFLREMILVDTNELFHCPECDDHFPLPPGFLPEGSERLVYDIDVHLSLIAQKAAQK